MMQQDASFLRWLASPSGRALVDASMKSLQHDAAARTVQDLLCAGMEPDTFSAALQGALADRPDFKRRLLADLAHR